MVREVTDEFEPEDVRHNEKTSYSKSFFVVSTQS